MSLISDVVILSSVSIVDDEKLLVSVNKIFCSVLSNGDLIDLRVVLYQGSQYHKIVKIINWLPHFGRFNQEIEGPLRMQS